MSGAALDELRLAIRARAFGPSGLTPVKATVVTFRELAALYRECHVLAKDLASAREYEVKVAPFLARFGDRALTDIRTADIEDVIADLRKPRMIGRRPGLRPLTPATINRTVDRLRHMFNWAVGREYLDRTPFKRGSATLIKKLHEDNKRRRRIDEHEEAALLPEAPPYIQAMLIAALDTGMRLGEMLAARFADVEPARGRNTLRGPDKPQAAKWRFANARPDPDFR